MFLCIFDTKVVSKHKTREKLLKKDEKILLIFLQKLLLWSLLPIINRAFEIDLIAMYNEYSYVINYDMRKY